MFRTNRPAVGGAFRNRRQALAELKTFVDKLQAGEPGWLAIIGPRKVGKTSLVLELERSLVRDSRLCFVVLDAENERPLSWELFRTYALRAADALLGAELPMSLELAAGLGDGYLDVLLASERARRFPPDLLAVLRALPTHSMDQAFVRVCLDLPERLAQELDRQVVLAFDEFQQLSSDWNLRRGDPLPVLRSVWQRHERVAYVVSGSGKTMLEELVTQKRSPFFEHFSIMYLDRFTTEDAVDLLLTGGPSDRPIPLPLARAAVQAVGHHPFYLQLLGDEIVRHPPPYSEQTLKEAVQDLLFSRNGRLALFFQNVHDRLVGSSSYLAAVLETLSAGPTRVSDLAKAIGVRTGDAVRYLERLGDAAKQNEDSTYEIEDPTFALWIAWRRPGGSAIPMSVVGDAAEREVAQVLSRMGFDLVYQSRASRGSFDLLATRGASQLGVQVKRSALPLRFDKPTWQRMNGDAKRLGWAWLVAAVDPDDSCVRFLDPARARRGKEVRLTQSSTIESVVAWLTGRAR